MHPPRRLRNRDGAPERGSDRGAAAPAADSAGGAEELA